ncbi:winged helix-turn-helix transcriptional regulator [Paenibacillus sp. TAB 01]|uniref:winged helix-turn-helix transcriptional regulator n=1 Tax=Paenibacillus sp. TAB 01 TaxID=3368988 RepID=UPI003751E6B2
MNLSNCRGCGKLHLQRAHVLCADCFKLHLEQSSRIKAFLQAHPGATVIDLARETGLSLNQVNELVGR